MAIKKRDKIGIFRDSTNAGGADYVFNYKWSSEDLDDMHKFLDELYKQNDEKHAKCVCGRYLDYPYIYIIDALKESGLLPESYNMMCCFCHILACIGLEIPDDWKEVRFSNPVIYGIVYYSTIRIKGVYVPTDEYFDLIIRIHDTEKTLGTGRILNDIKITKPEKWIVNLFV